MSNVKDPKGFRTGLQVESRYASKTLGVCVLVLLLAFALRFYQLGDKSLWGDEIAQATWSAWEWARLWQEFRAPPDFILHFALVHLAQQIGTSEFWVRLPSALTSLLCVPLTYVVALRLTNRATALVAMLLMAVAPYQIWYAQDARMYAALCCYALVSLYFFVRLIAIGDWRLEIGNSRCSIRDMQYAIGLTIGNTLAIYTHLFGVFPMVSEGVIALGILGAVWIRARRVMLPQWALFLGASFLVTGLLALPLASGTMPYALQGAKPAVDVSVAPTLPFQFTNAFAWELLGDFGLGAGEFWRTILSLVLALIGFGMLVWKKPHAAWITLVWIGAPLLILAITQPRHGVAARYLIFLQPLYLILVANGIIYGTRMVAARRGFFLGKFFRVHPRLAASRTLYAFIGLIVLGFIVAPPLSSLYRRAKLNDWRALAKYIERNAQAGDLIFGERNTPNMNALTYYLPNLLRYDTPPTSIDALQNAVNAKRRVWYISVGEYFDKEGEAWAREHLEIVPAQAWLDPALEYTRRDDFTFTQSEHLATIYFHDGEIPSEIVYRGRQGFANEGVEQLRVNPNETVEAKLRLQGAGTRVLEISFTSKKPAQFDVRVNGKMLAQVRETKATRGKQKMEWVLDEAEEIVLVRVKNVSGEFPFFVKALRLTR